jgi:hypothetical protein
MLILRPDGTQLEEFHGFDDRISASGEDLQRLGTVGEEYSYRHIDSAGLKISWMCVHQQLEESYYPTASMEPFCPDRTIPALIQTIGMADDKAGLLAPSILSAKMTVSGRPDNRLSVGFNVVFPFLPLMKSFNLANGSANIRGLCRWLASVSPGKYLVERHLRPPPAI